MDFEMILWC